MTKKLFFLALFSGSLLNAQTLFSENFEPDSPTIAQWDLLDLDGDGFQWHIVMGSEYTDAAGYAPGEMAASTGYNVDPSNPPSGPLNPNNVLISPAISIPTLVTNETVTLKYKVGPYLSSMANMSYSMYILPASQTFNLATATAIKTKAFTTMGALNETVDISSFAGENIKIYFRHHDGNGQWYLLLDDVIVEKKINMSTSETSIAKLSLYPNPVNQILNLKGIKNISSYEVFDTTGKLVTSGSAKGSSIDVSQLAIGKYIIKVKSDDGVYTESFIKK